MYFGFSEQLGCNIFTLLLNYLVLLAGCQRTCLAISVLFYYIGAKCIGYDCHSYHTYFEFETIYCSYFLLAYLSTHYGTKKLKNCTVEEIFSFIFLENAVFKHHEAGKITFAFAFPNPFF
jgi:hypothetical protein